MIRRLTAEDHQQVQDFLQQLPTFALFLTADIEKYGYESSVFTIWGIFSHTQELLHVFGKYYNTLVVYSNTDHYPAAEVCAFLSDQAIKYDTLVGRSILAEQFFAHLSFTDIYRNYYCELKPEHFTPLINEQLNVTKADLSHTEAILKLLTSIEEFSGLDFQEEAIKTYISDGGVYLLRENDEIASLAMCSARTERLANIGGVCTAKPYRQRGYASTVVSTISQTYLEQGLICCLSYNNPAAGAIYHRIGYQPVGHMIVARK
ncbi:MAG TPA: hypothetical protein DCE00_02175 [Firmicutes bacterium]|jgi:predicted GNAT family acetyltransferase|nr:GNAT family N-acetyltransferase [Bacillota bacterium]HAA37661.1 hypothetical protein [Bacillota bacterium]